MSNKREYFEDFINDLFQIEIEIIHNNKPKLHSTEQDLFDEVYNQIKLNGKFTEDLNLDKRIKNRLKNKILNHLNRKDIVLGDKDLRKDLASDISFYNLNDFKKHLRKIIKKNTNIENIHTFLLVFDELRNFFYKVKEQNEIKNYYEMLEENLELINHNLGASYFLRELDLDLSMKDSLTRVENKSKKIELMLQNELLIEGYKFKLARILCQHRINTGEWEEAKRIALIIENDLKEGKSYSRDNVAKLYALFVQIYNQTYNETKYKFYLEELGKSNDDVGFLEKQVLSLSTKMNNGKGFISKEMLHQAEQMAAKSDSERIKTFLRLVRTQYFINNEEYDKAKSQNDIFFIDIHNEQVREFLDSIYIQRFIILYHKKRFDEIITLFENKITQRRILSLEKKGKQMILPYIIYDLSKCRMEQQSPEITFDNIYRILDFYQYSNFLSCYTSLKQAIEIVLNGMKMNERDELKIRQLSKIIDETINQVN